MFKILTGKYDSEVSKFVKLSDQAPDTRGHPLKIAKFRTNTNLRKLSFTTRCTDTWNNLPDEVIVPPTINSFKNRLNMLWRTLPLLYNHEDNLIPRDISRPTYTHRYQVILRDYKKDMEILEWVQRRAIKLLPGFCNLSYHDWLRELGLPTLLYWRIRYDMIQLFRVLHHHDHINHFESRVRMVTDNRMRGHALSKTGKTKV